MNNLSSSTTILRRAERPYLHAVVTPRADRMYFRELDGLRFLAFFLVFLNHHSLFSKTPYYSDSLDYPWVAVDVFFVLSAFLTTRLLRTEYEKNKTISFKKFYVRRVFRIWPIYFFIVGLSFLGLVIKHEAITKDIWTRFIGLLTFSDNIMAASRGFNHLPFTLHLWAIGYEEQFCILIPFVVLLLTRSSVKVRITCLIIAVLLLNAIRLVFITNNAAYPAIYVLPVTHFESMIMGMIMGFGGTDFIFKRMNPVTTGLIYILLFALVFLLPTIESPTSYWHIVSYTYAGIFAALLLYSVSHIKYLKQVFSNKILVFLGKRSYGLFMYHLIGIGMANYMVTHIPFIPSAPLPSFLYSLAFTILIAVGSYEIIEKPFLKLKKKFEVITTRPV